MPTSSSSRATKARRLGRGRPGLLAPFDPWKSSLCTCPFKLSLNPYTGCSFKCLYCYATAYIGVRDSTPKKDFLSRLKREASRWPPEVPINIGTSSDPYPPEEASYGLTRAALELLIPQGRRILITTKGTLYATRDLQLLASGNVAVTPTITTRDKGISLLVEPGAPLPEGRISALARASEAGVPVGVRIDPIIPYINDDPYELEALVEELAGAGAKMIVTSTFKARPDSMARLRNTLGASLGERLYKLYKEKGLRIQGYTYLPKSMRERLLKPVIRAARRLGMEYATCREGLAGPEWFTAKTCDGTHLIPRRIEPAGKRLDDWIR